MDDGSKTALAAAIAGALDWWHEAGIDGAFHDRPTQWISPARPTAEEGAPARAAQHVAAAIPEPAPVQDAASWPQDLAGFAQWWLTEPWLDDGRSAGRVPPRGPPGAALMVLVPDPEREDRDRLLSGAQGRLLAAMLAAMGIADGDVYVASALPRATPMPDWRRLAAQGFGKLLAHHVALVRPARLIAFGDSVLSLAGHHPPKTSADLRQFDSQGRRVPLLATRSLDALLARPVWKGEVWQAWLDWTA